jgi:predicted GNAT family N-acyltransferase
MLLETAIRQCREEIPQGREGLVLTCKEAKLHYYARFGFVNEGISSSEHGGAAWYQMRIRF